MQQFANCNGEEPIWRRKNHRVLASGASRSADAETVSSSGGGIRCVQGVCCLYVRQRLGGSVLRPAVTRGLRPDAETGIRNSCQQTKTEDMMKYLHRTQLYCPVFSVSAFPAASEPRAVPDLTFHPGSSLPCAFRLCLKQFCAGCTSSQNLLQKQPDA